MTYQIEPNIVWPDPEAIIRSWLVANMASAPNIRTETDSTFGTSAPNSTMTLPLVLVQRVPGGGTDADMSTETAVVDIQCFAANRAAMWLLYREVHAWMLRLSGQKTDFGTVDLVVASNGGGNINYANPDVNRVVATYEIQTRPFSADFALPH
jgi:hypothetical protein